jgi:hypothetical protein
MTVASQPAVCLARLDLLRTFQNQEDVAHLAGEDVGSDQLMDALMVLVAEPDGLARILLLDLRLDVHGGVDDVLHWPWRD